MGLNKKEMASYGIGAVGKDMVYMFCASYILYYYQDILGVSAIAMGIILLAARVFDAFNDPIMGVVVAKTRTRCHLVIFDHEAPSGFTTCEMPIFGYRVAFASSDQLQRLKPEGISRCWDFSLPADPHEVLWHGCARRNINGYVPHYSQDDLLNPECLS